MSQRKFKILFADDDPILLGELTPALEAWGYEVDPVSNVEEAKSKLENSAQYDCFLADLQIPNAKDGFGMIAHSKRVDEFLPVVVLSGSMIPHDSAKAIKIGATYFIPKSDLGELQTNLGKLMSPQLDVGEIYVVKFGGSSLDFDRTKRRENIEQVVAEIKRQHQELGRLFIITPGAGQYGLVAKDWYAHHGHIAAVELHHGKRIKQCLEMNGEDICDLFNGAAEYVPFHKTYKVDAAYLEKTIPIIPLAPRHICRMYDIPLEDSDTHTLAIAQFWGAYRIVLLKRTDGIYTFDPYRGAEISDEEWTRQQEENDRFDIVTPQQLLGIDREAYDVECGRVTPGHLMEDSSLYYMADHANRVGEICLSHIAPRELFHLTETMGPAGATQQLTPTHRIIPGTEYYSTVDSFRRALNGECFSKIVRG